MYNIIPKFFCFCNNNLLCFMLFLFFLYFQSILKKLSTRCTSQFVGLWPGWGWGCRSEYGSQIQEYIPQSKVCGLRKCFLIHPRECLKKAFCKVGGVDWEMIFKYISELFSYCFVVILLFFQLCAVPFYLYTIFLF